MVLLPLCYRFLLKTVCVFSCAREFSAVHLLLGQPQVPPQSHPPGVLKQHLSLAWLCLAWSLQSSLGWLVRELRNPLNSGRITSGRLHAHLEIALESPCNFNPPSSLLLLAFFQALMSWFIFTFLLLIFFP